MVKEKVRQFLAANFLHLHPEVELTDSFPLLEKRFLDSMAVMELVAFIEEEFAITVPETDIVDANLKSLTVISQYVCARAALSSP